MGAFRESVVGSLGARQGKSYRGKVLLHPYVVMGLLGDLVQTNCNGRMHVDDMTPWKGRVGEQVASKLLTVYEDPTDRDFAQWSPFDREGVPTARHALIENGRLAFVAYDGFSARRAGTASTGNAGGGAEGLPSVGFSNVSVTVDRARGKMLSDADLSKELGSGLVVKRFSGNVDAQSGHFSGIAKNSWWVQDGVRAHAVNEVMISGQRVRRARPDRGRGRHAAPAHGLGPRALPPRRRRERHGWLARLARSGNTCGSLAARRRCAIRSSRGRPRIASQGLRWLGPSCAAGRRASAILIPDGIAAVGPATRSQSNASQFALVRGWASR